MQAILIEMPKALANSSPCQLPTCVVHVHHSIYSLGFERYIIGPSLIMCFVMLTVHKLAIKTCGCRA